MSYLDRDPYAMYKKDKSSGKKGPGPELMGADTLIGNNVSNHLDESLGEIKEIMLDMRNGKIAYAVLAFGDFLGLGGKLFAVPWNALTLDTENKCFKLSIEKSRLESAPGFDKDDWPDMADHLWADKIHSYYGTTPYYHEEHAQLAQAIETGEDLQAQSGTVQQRAYTQERRFAERRHSMH
jgi:hypothetical protein